MDMMTMVQRLTAVYGISGREAAVAEEIRRMAEPYRYSAIPAVPSSTFTMNLKNTDIFTKSGIF